MPSTVDTSTTLLFHGDVGFDERSGRRTTGVQVLPAAPITGVSSARAKFGASSLDTMSSSFGGLRFRGAAPFNASTYMAVDWWMFLRSHRSTGSRPVAITAAGDSTDVFSLYINSSGSWVGTMRDLGGVNAIPPLDGHQFGLNTWVHVALTHEPGGLRKVFVDGVLKASTSSASGSPLPNMLDADLCIGGRGTNDLSLDGFVDEVRFVYGIPTYTTDFVPPSAPYADVAPATNVSAVPAPGARREPLFTSLKPQAATKPFALRDIQSGGRGRINDVVEVIGTPNYPVRRRVWLMRERDAMVVRETWSDPVTGAYSFDWIDERERYTVITHDYLHNFRAVIADNLIPDLMP